MFFLFNDAARWREQRNIEAEDVMYGVKCFMHKSSDAIQKNVKNFQVLQDANNAQRGLRI